KVPAGIGLVAGLAIVAVIGVTRSGGGGGQIGSGRVEAPAVQPAAVEIPEAAPVPAPPPAVAATPSEPTPAAVDTSAPTPTAKAEHAKTKPVTKKSTTSHATKHTIE